MVKEYTAKRHIRPAHPGLVLADMLEDINMTQGELAKRIKTSRQTVSAIINGRERITVDFAIRLGIFCGNGPDIWLNLQRAVDLWDEQNKPSRKKIYSAIKPVKVPSASL
jgi:antitoxin HigA-1